MKNTKEYWPKPITFLRDEGILVYDVVSTISRAGIQTVDDLYNKISAACKTG